MDVRLKLLLTLAALVAVTMGSFERWWIYLCVMAGVLSLWFRSGVPLKRFFLRCLIVLPVAAGLALLFLLSYGLQRGWSVALETVVRILLAVAVVYTLTATTPMPALLHGLARMRVPSLFVATLAFMARYLHVFRDELLRMRRARECRTFAPNAFGQFRDIGWFLAVLVIRAFERSERVYAAMNARSWNPRKGWPPPLPLSAYAADKEASQSAPDQAE